MKFQRDCPHKVFYSEGIGESERGGAGRAEAVCSMDWLYLSPLRGVHWTLWPCSLVERANESEKAASACLSRSKSKL